MAEEKKHPRPQNIILEERSRLSVTGVTDVDSFDEETVTLSTELGKLVIRGSGLHINRIDVDSGELTVEGEVSSLTYEELPAAGGFLARLFR